VTRHLYDADGPDDGPVSLTSRPSRRLLVTPILGFLSPEHPQRHLVICFQLGNRWSSGAISFSLTFMELPGSPVIPDCLQPNLVGINCCRGSLMGTGGCWQHHVSLWQVFLCDLKFHGD